MVSSLTKMIISRFQKLVTDDAVYREDMVRISEYIYPNSLVEASGSPVLGVNSEKTSERGKRKKILDNIAEQNLEDLAAFIVGILAPAGSKWLMLLPEDPSLLKTGVVTRHLDDAAEKIMKYLFKPEVKFHLMFDETALENIAWGMGIPYVRKKIIKGRNELRFKSIARWECFFQEDEDDNIDTCFRRKSITAKQIMQEYILPASSNYDIDETVLSALKDAAQNDPNKKYELIYAVVPEGDEIHSATKIKSPYVGVHLFKDGADADKSGILKKGELERFPYFPYRFRKRPGELNGYGPAHRGIANVITLQSMKKSNLRAANLMVEPPYDIPENRYTKKLNISPGAANHSKRTGNPSGQREKAEPLLLVGNVPIGVEMEDREKDAINRAFYANEIAEQKNAEMSATESNIRLRERLQKLMPQLSRIVVEFLNPCIEYVYEFLKEQKIIDDEPRELAERGISPVYISALMKAQSDADISSLERLAAVLAQVSQAFPGALEGFAEGQIPKFLVDKLFLPQSLLKTEADMKADKAAKQAREANTVDAGAAKDASVAGLNVAKTNQLLAGM